MAWSWTADAAFAAADELHQVACVLGRHFRFDARQGVLLLQSGTVENLIGRLQRGDFFFTETGAAESNQDSVLGCDVEIRVQKIRWNIAVDSRGAPIIASRPISNTDESPRRRR